MNGRLYDPMVHRFLMPDNFVQDPYSTQNFNRYGYVLNNPLMFTDPSGEIIWAVVGMAALIGATAGAVGYIINATMTGNWSLSGFALSVLGGAVTGALGGVVAPGMFPAVTSSSYFWGAVGAGVASGFLPAVNIPIGDFSFSLSPSIAFGTGGFNLGLSGNAGYKSKGFAFSVGGSLGKNGSNLGGGFTIYDNKNKQAFSLGATIYGGKHSQKNWFLGYQKGDFSFKMTNDAWTGSTSDEYRTAAFEFGIGAHSLGWNLYTTSPDKQEYDQQTGGNLKWMSPIWNGQKNDRYGNNIGTYNNVNRIYSGFYFGFKAFNGNYRIGHDGAWSQDFFQNGLHKIIGSPYVNSSLNPSSNLFFQYYRSQNPWSLYAN